MPISVAKAGLLSTIALVSLLVAGCGRDGGDDEPERARRPAPRAQPVTVAPRAEPAAHPVPAEAASILDADGKLALRDAEAQTAELLRYYETIELSPAQQEVKREALEPLPAPCCSDFSALTCCCECNLSRTVWGLAHYLIVQDRSAEEVRSSVQQWLAFVNPSGFGGGACSTGGCGRPFAQDGCGGMRPDRVVFDG